MKYSEFILQCLSWPSEEKQLQSIKKQQVAHKSPRLQVKKKAHKQFIFRDNHIQRVQALPSPLTSNILMSRKVSCFITLFCHYITDLIEVPQHSYIHHKLSEPSQKQKWVQEAEHSSPQIENQLSLKQLRTSPSSCIAEKNLHQEVTSDISKSSTDSLQYWIQNRRWHREYFEQDSQIREDFEKSKSPEELDQKSWLQEHCFKESFRPMHSLHHLFVRKKFSSSLHHKSSESNL